MLKIFIIQDKRLLIYSTQELDLKPFTKQSRMKQKVNDLKNNP